jgi:23S rRNA pseudouridine2605 synthase
VVSPLTFQYVIFNKPPGYACTRHDPHATKIIYDLLPKELHHLMHVGRLDIDSEGLLLLTNDGEWLNQVIHPRNQISKKYEVEVSGKPTREILASACKGIRSKGELLKIENARVVRVLGDSTLLEAELREGKNREIRRIFGTLGHEVLRLQRISIGNLELGDLKPGCWRELTPEERNRVLQSGS